jgi:preprotein translocase subunit SecG
MSTVETVLLSLLVIDALALITLVLIQQGKGADVGAAFGSGSSNTVFGSSGGATAMTRLTTWLAIGFFVIAFGLAYTAKERSEQAGNLGIPQVMNSASENATDLPSSDGLTPAADDQSDEIPEF